MLQAVLLGNLIEANSRLVAEPNLLKTSRTYAGFIGLALPSNESSRMPREFGAPARVATELLFDESCTAADIEEERVDREQSCKDVD